MAAASPPASPPAAASAGEGLRARRRRELRERVLEVARALFAAQGFEATTVDQIAEAAGIAPATFFNHFQSKQALLAEMTGEVVEVLSTLVHAHLRADASTREQLLGLAEAAARDLAQHHTIARTVMIELLRNRARPEQTAPYLERLSEPFIAMLEAGQRRGEVRRDEPAEFLAEMVLGALNAPVSRWLADPTHPVTERLPRAAAFVWNAICAPASNR